MKVKLLTTALIFSLLACAALAYLWIDRSVTLSYVEQGADEAITSTHELEWLLGSEWSGMPEPIVLEKLRAEAARHRGDNILVKEENGAIWFDQTRFNFENGRLISVGEHMTSGRGPSAARSKP